MNEDQDAQENENEAEDWERTDDDKLVCPNCSGTGMTGNGMFEASCTLCGETGTITEEQAERYDPNDPFLGMPPTARDVRSLMYNSGLPMSLQGLGVHGFDGADFREDDFSGETLDGLSFDNCNLDGASFVDASLSGSSFSGCSLVGARFDGALMGTAGFSRCNAREATFDGADLSDAEIWEVDLANASFATTKLGKTSFLDGSTLTGSSLQEADTLEGVALDDVRGLSTEQILACFAKGAYYDDPSPLPQDLHEAATVNTPAEVIAARNAPRNEAYWRGYGEMRRMNRSVDPVADGG